MAETSWPSPNHNSRAVDDTEFEQLTHPEAGDGLIGTPADTSFAYADGSGMNVKIRSGKFALVRGHMYSSGASDLTKTVTANASGLTRVDLLVLRLTRATWDVTSEVKAGAPGSGAPALTQDTGTTGVFEIPVATITVPSGDVSISSDQVVAAGYYLGEPLIVCTSSTRPGHAPGRRIWETDTAITYVSTGAAWRLLQPTVFTSSTRPSHQAGLLIYESDTARLMMSTGAAWRVVGDEAGVVAVSIQSGCSASANSLLRRNGFATLALTVRKETGLAAGQATQVATVASGFRPQFEVSTSMAYPTGSGQSLRMSVSTDGAVRIHTPTGLQWNGDRDILGSVTWPVA